MRSFEMPTPLKVETIKYCYLKLLIMLKSYILSLQDFKKHNWTGLLNCVYLLNHMYLCKVKGHFLEKRNKVQYWKSEGKNLLLRGTGLNLYHTFTSQFMILFGLMHFSLFLLSSVFEMYLLIFLISFCCIYITLLQKYIFKDSVSRCSSFPTLPP